jgi:hypothetical protein
MGGVTFLVTISPSFFYSPIKGEDTVGDFLSADLGTFINLKNKLIREYNYFL